MVYQFLIEEQFKVDDLFLHVLRRLGNEYLLNQPAISGKHLMVTRIGFEVFPKNWFVAHRVTLVEVTPLASLSKCFGLLIIVRKFVSPGGTTAVLGVMLISGGHGRRREAQNSEVRGPNPERREQVGCGGENDGPAFSVPRMANSAEPDRSVRFTGAD